VTAAGSRKAQRGRWRREIVGHLAEPPRQYAALESAMAAFGDDFDPDRFKAAFETDEDMEAYNRVQAVERALGRVQNFVGELAVSGVKLAGLPPPSGEAHGSAVQRAFESLREAGAISGALCRRLVRAQVARSTIEHEYLGSSAGDVHRAAELVHAAAREFLARYRPWVEPYLTQNLHQTSTAP
jgi:hypothetical protein